MEIRIQALDTLFFRDGKPFEKGDWADGSIIPNPSVVYGALRTAFASANAIPFKDVAVGKALTEDVFKIHGIYYRIDENNVLPLPLDLVEYEKDAHTKIAEKEAKRYEVKPLIVKKLDGLNIISSKKLSTKHFLFPQNMGRVQDLENGLIVTTELSTYLKNELASTQAYKLHDFVQNEPKIGIGRENATKVSEDGNLFRVDMQRSDTFQIGVSITNSSDYTKYADLIKMGGETKMVNLFRPRIPMRVIKQKINFADNRFKIYFSTPTILNNGVPNLSKLGIDGDEVELITSYVGKPLHIGGFDMFRKRPKPMYKVVPAGSIFYYQAKKEVSLLNNHQGTSLSDRLSEQGFGICYFGTWNINQ